MSDPRRPLDVPICFCFLPTAPQWVPLWKDVHKGGKVPDGAFATYATLDGRFLYRIVDFPDHQVVERAKIVRGEFRPHLFYAKGDWGSMFPTLEAWVELARSVASVPRAPDDAMYDSAETDMIQRVAEDWGVTEEEVRAEIDAREAELFGED